MYCDYIVIYLYFFSVKHMKNKVMYILGYCLTRNSATHLLQGKRETKKLSCTLNYFTIYQLEIYMNYFDSANLFSVLST